jgi:hypothetical protein
MSKKTLYRLSALAGVLSGLCIIIGKLLIPLPNRQIGEIVDFFSPFLPFFSQWVSTFANGGSLEYSGASPLLCCSWVWQQLLVLIILVLLSCLTFRKEC